MTKKTYSILEFNWESVYGNKEKKQSTFDYYGKLFIKEHEPFRFIGTAVLDGEDAVATAKLTITNRFYEEVEKEWQTEYLKAIEAEVEAKARIFK